MKKLLTIVLALAMMATLFTVPAVAEEPIRINVINASSGTPSADVAYKQVQDWILENTGVYVNSINLDGTYHCTKYALPLMMAHGGAIINTASSAGVSGIPGCAAYTATKGATVTLTRSLAVDYGKYNIRTNCIAPAAIETEMVKESNLNDPNFDNEFFLKQITPLRRWGKPEDVAALAVFLASDEAGYLNGTIIPCDGGITINGNVNKEI